MRKTMLLRGCFYGLGLFLLPAPLFLLAGTAAGIGAGLLLPLLAALLLGMAVRGLKRGLRISCVLAGMAVCFGLALLAAEGAQNSVWKWAGAAGIALAAALYPRYIGLFFGNGIFAGVWFAGLAVYGFTWAVSALLPLPEAAALVMRFAWIYSVYLIFVLTVDSLREGVGAGRTPSRSMLLKNVCAGAVWAALFLLLTHIPQIAQAVKACLDALARAVAWLLTLFRQESGTPLSPGGGSGFSGFGAETQEPSWLMKLLEKAFYVIGIALAILAAGMLLWLAGKALLRAVRFLAAKLRAYMDAVNENYEDHVESLLDWGEVKRGIERRRAERRQVRKDRVPWERLTPREQVRRSYRGFLMRHPDIAPQRTARQALREGRQADIYEAARYSSREITSQEAREMKSL